MSVASSVTGRIDDLLASCSDLRVISWPAANGIIFGPVTTRLGAVEPGALFVACADDPQIAARDASLALRLGASVIATGPATAANLSGVANALLVVADPAEAYPTLCASVWGRPHTRLRIHGVTGTKGKTTTCVLLERILLSAGRQTGLINGLWRRILGREVRSDGTTPDPWVLHSTFRSMVNAGMTDCVLEVSSIGIEERRVLGIELSSAVFTNLGRDHLTYHGGLQKYASVKRRLFGPPYLVEGVAIVNGDDPFGRRICLEKGERVTTYGLRRGDMRPEALVLTKTGISLRINGVMVSSPLSGAHNAYNIVGAACAALSQGVPLAAVAEGIASVRSIPGRCEIINPHAYDRAGSACDGPEVIVDYAHTAESVAATVRWLEIFAAGRPTAIVVGASGRSDRDKRAAIGRLAANAADLCVITLDSTRGEDPSIVAGDILAGARSARSANEVVFRANRREAILTAISGIGRSGVVLLLGRGTDDRLRVGDEAQVLDDRIVAREMLALLYGDTGEPWVGHDVRRKGAPNSEAAPASSGSDCELREP